MVKLTCDCCRFTQEFEDTEIAFEEGWDAPPHFKSYISCPFCPVSFLYGIDHFPIHKQWNETGRPKEFSQETCVIPEERIPQGELDAFESLLKGIYTKEVFK